MLRAASAVQTAGVLWRAWARPERSPRRKRESSELQHVERAPATLSKHALIANQSVRILISWHSFCIYMRKGPCGDSFRAWEECVKVSETVSDEDDRELERTRAVSWDCKTADRDTSYLKKDKRESIPPLDAR